MHTYNTRGNKHRVYNELIALDAYPYADRIKVTSTENGEGHHLRWQWSEESLQKIDYDDGEDDDDDETYREGSPSAASTSSWSSGASDATEMVDDDGDSVMGGEEDEDRLQTPIREAPYDPGSVILTPRKGRILRREPSIDGSFAVWHEQAGVEGRLVFREDTSRYRGDDRQKRALVRCESTATSLDDDAVSIASDATVQVDPRATPQPTLLNRAMPLVRQPTWPADYDLNAPGPSNAGPQWPARHPEWSGIRIWRDANGQWVREGSLGPDASYQVNTEDLPPRIDRDDAPAPAVEATSARRARAAPLRRTDTEPVLDVPTPKRRR
ncbi:hypothetical protein BV20DRAFT_576654 [Pilatotrama ljubarskyi]|nr:hypothetical protein BV20DRAFT_576654 [Pilatotrama ljubarskyi]